MGNNGIQSGNDTIGIVKSPEYAMSLASMMKKVEKEPKPKFIYSAIKEGSIGIIFGPSKSGKTMFCENLGMSIAAGKTEYLGKPIDIENRKVFMVSMEEFHTHRTERNSKQVDFLPEPFNTNCMNNFVVAGKDIPRYIHSEKDWELLSDVIKEQNPGVVILDSITRMCQGIEESAVAQNFMKKLRQLSVDTGTTILAIHHTTKMFGTALGIDNIAGSRVVAQEVDFAIGVNKTIGGVRYIKDVFFRYAPDDKETVTEFAINSNCWLDNKGEVYEAKVLATLDGRRNDDNSNKIIRFLSSKADTDSPKATWADMESNLVPGQMSRSTFHKNLTKLIEAKKIGKSGDEYQLVA